METAQILVGSIMAVPWNGPQGVSISTVCVLNSASASSAKIRIERLANFTKSTDDVFLSKKREEFHRIVVRKVGHDRF
jgi:hypothetical protein